MRTHLFTKDDYLINKNQRVKNILHNKQKLRFIISHRQYKNYQKEDSICSFYSWMNCQTTAISIKQQSNKQSMLKQNQIIEKSNAHNQNIDKLHLQQRPNLDKQSMIKKIAEAFRNERLNRINYDKYDLTMNHDQLTKPQNSSYIKELSESKKSLESLFQSAQLILNTNSNSDKVVINQEGEHHHPKQFEDIQPLILEINQEQIDNSTPRKKSVTLQLLFNAVRKLTLGLKPTRQIQSDIHTLTFDDPISSVHEEPRPQTELNNFTSRTFTETVTFNQVVSIHKFDKAENVLTPTKSQTQSLDNNQSKDDNENESSSSLSSLDESDEFDNNHTVQLRDKEQERLCLVPILKLDKLTISQQQEFDEIDQELLQFNEAMNSDQSKDSKQTPTTRSLKNKQAQNNEITDVSKQRVTRSKLKTLQSESSQVRTRTRNSSVQQSPQKRLRQV